MTGTSYHGDDLEAAVRRVQLGEKIITVSNDTGIPYETLRKHHADTLRANRDPYPGDQAIREMVDHSLQLLWDELQHIRQSSGKNGQKRLDIKRISEIGAALKTFDQLKRSNPATTAAKPESPLAALNGNH